MRILSISVALLVYSNQATIKTHQFHSAELSDEAPFHRPGVSYSKHHHFLPTDSFNCVTSAIVQLLCNLSPHPKHCY